jgi:hypothetical protein
MKKLIYLLFYVGIIVLFSGFSGSEKANEKACWGQATAIFAQMGEMGEHASQQPTPRLGLRNLARALYDAGVIPDDSMESLGEFVANELGLRIEACE